jgi:hypothetical protein
MSGFFSRGVAEADPELFKSINGELARQQNQIELIASENIVSRAVLEAQGSVLTNKYAEGYPGRRYYGGCEYVDIAEELAIERAKRLFDCAFVNVQPHSGAQANQGVLLALCQPGDTIMGLSLAAGGHLTPRRAAESLREMVQGSAVRRAPGRRPDRFRRARAAGQGASAEIDHRRRLGLSAHHRLQAISAPLPIPSALIFRSTWRILPGLWQPVCIRARCRTLMS